MRPERKLPAIYEYDFLARDATASAEWRWLNGWSVAATFEGEFSDVTRSYAGKGVVRYAW